MPTPGVNYGALQTYTSYDLAWLGPIVYPLSFALIAQAIVYSDMVSLFSRKRGVIKPPSRTSQKLSRGSIYPESRSTSITLLVMSTESLFALLCITQCIINFATRSFAGTDAACDFQAFYATYYTFASLSLSAFAVFFALNAILYPSASYTTKTIIASGLLLHAAALLIAALPLMEEGTYMFAGDYCTWNAESPMYAALFLVCYFASGVVVARSIFTAYNHKGRLNEENREGGLRMVIITGAYFFASWMTSLVLVLLYLSQGQVRESSAWRIYGAQAIILHTNQLVTPLLVGYYLRYYMIAASSPNKPLASEEIDKKGEICDGPEDHVNVLVGGL